MVGILSQGTHKRSRSHVDPYVVQEENNEFEFSTKDQRDEKSKYKHVPFEEQIVLDEG